MQDDIQRPSQTAKPEESPVPEPTIGADQPQAPSQQIPVISAQSEPEATVDNSPAESVAPVQSVAPEPVGETTSESAEGPVSPIGAVPVSSEKPKKSKLWLAVLLLLIVIVIGVIVALKYLHKTTPTSTATGKKDIPLLTVGLPSGKAFPSPYPNSTNTTVATQLNSQLFEGLVGYQGLSNIQPLLATGWANPDNTHWVFTLRQGVHFHSGRTLTPEDVKASLDYAVAHQKDQDGSLVLSLASTIKEVAVDGANKVIVTTDGPDPTLLNRLANLYIFDAKATPGDANAGTGPYRLASGTTISDTTVDLKAFDSYWGGHVYTRELKIVSVADPATLATDLAAGKYDVAGTFSSNQPTSLPNMQVSTQQDFGTNFLGLNTLNMASPLHTLAARQAAAYALNVPAILKADNTKGQQSSQLIPPAVPGYDPSIKSMSFNLAKAKQLLATVPNATTTPLTFVYGAPDAAIGKEITAELTAAGFKIQTTEASNLNDLVGMALSGKVDMYYLGYSSDTLDGLDILSTLLVGNKDYNNAQVNDLAQQASTTLDPAKRIALLQKISQQAAADLPDIPLFTKTNTYAVQNSYHLTVDIPNTYVGAYFWKVYQE